MDGRAFLVVARELLQGATEAYWRAAAGRTYYALMLEARELLGRWGLSCPPRDDIHKFVRLRLLYSADPDLKHVGVTLERLGRLRNVADYELSDTDVASRGANSSRPQFGTLQKPSTSWIRSRVTRTVGPRRSSPSDRHEAVKVWR